ncbi:helix-turn-helix domain-containing protein [Fulvivirga sediminis]|uniref:Helix-turn-helix domain-containing protein n=1 Tax=Fulvivirga sediminis TaxID=2803949 RepID=A0A937FCV7_9BACT|nr:helix-turn-helix domain-containing protein [Fulvivirga sediminis]MBL3658874.1 helix-turn-helix domain-containing protein [Fulvivirga sediminis]
MEVIIIENESYKQLLAQLHQVITRATRDAIIETLSATDPTHDWITAGEAMKILNCKKNKLVELRDLKEITSSQHGRKYSYSKRSIQAFLERNIV